MRNVIFVACLFLSACGLHANPAAWSAHDRVFECNYSHTEAVMAPNAQRLAMSTVRRPMWGNGQCDSWSFSSHAPRRMVYDCIEFLGNSADCVQFTNRMFQCDACYISWRDSQ